MAHSKKKKSLLWEVRHADDRFAGYVFGTMHTRDQRVHQLLPALEAFLARCSVLSNEFAVFEASQNGQPAIAPVDDWLPTLNKRQQKAFRQLLTRHELGDPEMYGHLPPLLVLQALVEAILGQESSQPFDMALAIHAEAMGLTLSGIETLEEQLGILEHIPLELQKKQLIQVLNHRSKYQKQIRKQVDWYLRQDIQQLYRVSRKQLGKLRNLLLLDRNKRMAKRMVRMYSNETHFMAIGAAHLWGDKGVLSLLRKKGMILKPVRSCLA
ncbi:MAG: TraB/GumN family protein [Saprospiraceae bacterium]